MQIVKRVSLEKKEFSQLSRLSKKQVYMYKLRKLEFKMGWIIITVRQRKKRKQTEEKNLKEVLKVTK